VQHPTRAAPVRSLLANSVDGVAVVHRARLERTLDGSLRWASGRGVGIVVHMNTNWGVRGLALALLLTCGCSKKDVKPGDPCETQGEIQCVDKQTGAFCVDGKYEALTCEGATGCMMVAGSGSCTHQNYQVGEACFQEGVPQCTGDKKAMIKCEKSHWVKMNDCKGALGCVANAEGAKCDLGASAAGEDCTAENEGNAACTEDKKSLLLCKGGKMQLASTCKGRHGCRQKGTELECDSSFADLDDPCLEEGGMACNADKTTRLVCKGGKMAKERDCKCSVMIDQVNCN